MQQAQTNSKKWVDYSDSSEEQPGSDHEIPVPPPSTLVSVKSAPIPTSTQPNYDYRSQQYIQQQLDRLSRCPYYHKEVWIQVVSDDQVFLDKKVFELKDTAFPGITIFQINQEIKGTWNLRVKKNLIEDWLKNGMDSDHKIKVIVSLKNFEKKVSGQDDKERGERRERGRGERRERGDRPYRGDRGDRGDRGQRGERGERRGRGRREYNNGQNRGEQGGERGGDRRRRQRGDRDKGQKKVYIDKETGKPPTNKQQCQKRLMEQKERQYTRNQAEKVGMELGNFRNKPKTQVKEVEQQSKIQQKTQFERKPMEEPITKKPKQVVMWARKDRNQKDDTVKPETNLQTKAEETVKAKPKYTQKSSKYTQKKEDGAQRQKQGDKKKKYVRVDKMTEEQREQLKNKKVQPEAIKQDKKQQSLLSEDSS